MNKQRSNTRVMVIGATGYLGLKIARRVKAAGYHLVALAREGSNMAPLERLGADIVRGDLTHEASLHQAFAGVDMIISTANGYTGRRPGDSLETVDAEGNHNLARAAKGAGIKRLVFLSILTTDQAVRVPHFYQKYRSENYFEELGLPFVALRPGGFLDQVLDQSRESIENGLLPVVMDPDARFTLILAEDVAAYAVQALEAAGVEGRRIDIGMDEPSSFRRIAAGLSEAMGREIRLQPFPKPEGEIGLTIDYIASGTYVADVSEQSRRFGPAPTLQASLAQWLSQTPVAAQPVPQTAPADGDH
jgi:uncharacterized protein YbjT (DUF2867 family)